MNYWLQFNLGTWQFWISLFLLIAPLVVLYFVLDRRRAFRIGFYGFNVHVWFNYIDNFGVTSGLWTYPFKVFPYLSVNSTLEASFIPVSYMLVYQWALKRQLNYYVYATVLSATFAFVLKPLMTWLSFFKMYQWVNYFYLFLGYVVIMLLSKWVTDFFAYLQKRQGGNTTSGDVVASEVGNSKLNKWRRSTVR